MAGESDKPFVKTYMESFKKNFLRSNVYGWLCFLPCGYSRFSDYKTPINYKKIC
ncbi:YesL family protein [Jeotgalibaca porci]|uniref:YesL family protein n=1 Tax=Jeotgalibaca porci TaxID=1868793 RepID=UPI003F8E2C7B